MVIQGVRPSNVKIQNASGTSTHKYNNTTLNELKNVLQNNVVTLSGGNYFFENNADDSTISINGGGYQQIENRANGSKIYTGATADTINIISASNNTINSGAGSNVISIEGSSNSVVSGSANDTITYKGAENIINAGDGKNDTFKGGTGYDVFVYDGGGDVVITDYEGKKDIIQLAEGYKLTDAKLTRNENNKYTDITFTISDENDSVGTVVVKGAKNVNNNVFKSIAIVENGQSIANATYDTYCATTVKLKAGTKELDMSNSLVYKDIKYVNGTGLKA
ncbi:MAG: hypothetical protein IJ728_01330, partial [Selenomonadaceae bacterium]|nr:hypothetical protein [Selenomonadaceae bacterium]